MIVELVCGVGRMDRFTRRSAIFGTLGLTLLSSNRTFAEGPNWPTGMVRVVVPAGGGQGTDIFARYFCDKFSTLFGQPFVVDNRPGASGMIGTDVVAKAKPDGQTLLFSNASSTVMLAGLGLPTPYDLQKDLQPIVQIAAGGVLLVVSPSFPAQNLAELIEIVRANPDKYLYGTWGLGTSAHLVMEGIKSKTGIKIGHVAYKSTGQVQQALMSGELQIGWCDLTSGYPLVKQGLIKPLAVSGSKRAPKTPEIKTVVEQGVPLDNDGWYCMLCPANTPLEIVDRINAEVNKIIQTDEWRERLLTFNAPNGPPNSASDFAKTIQRDIKTWTQIVRDNNIRVN